MGFNTLATRTENTFLSPVRIVWEGVNALTNIPRQSLSAIKNITEVQKQTLNALVHNFLDFSKVEGKWYQKMIKIPINAISACTRRPAMILASDITSSVNQGIWQPFKKLWYTPGKTLKGMRNATRLFSKTKGFDFQTYDTHETPDIWITKNQNKWFFGVKAWSSQKESDKKWEKESDKKSEKKVSKDTAPDKKTPAQPEVKTPTSSESAPVPPPNTQKSIDAIKAKNTAETQQKEQQDQQKNFPNWKMLSVEQQQKYAKQYNAFLNNDPTIEGILAYGKDKNMGNTTQEIIENLKKEEPTFAGYLQDIVDKSQPLVNAG